MTLSIDRGLPTLHEGEADEADLILKTDNKTLNRLVGLMNLDAFQDIVALQWPWAAFENPGCLAELNRLLADDSRLADLDQKRRNILFEHPSGNLVVKSGRNRVTDLRLLNPAENLGRRFRNPIQIGLSDVELEMILSGGLDSLSDLLVETLISFDG